MKLPTAKHYGVTQADFPEQDWSVWESRRFNHPGLGRTMDTSYLNVWPCCIQCATWICSGCYDFRRGRADRRMSQYCPKCGGVEGFFSATRHGTRNPHGPHVRQVPFRVPRMTLPPFPYDEAKCASCDKLTDECTCMPSDDEVRAALARSRQEIIRELPAALGEFDRMMSQACPAGDPCPGTGCPACCPSYDPCREKSCTFRCHNPRLIREGDPRYNLVQDLIEGDGPTQDKAERKLKEMGMYEDAGERGPEWKVPPEITAKEAMERDFPELLSTTEEQARERGLLPPRLTADDLDEAVYGEKAEAGVGVILPHAVKVATDKIRSAFAHGNGPEDLLTLSIQEMQELCNLAMQPQTSGWQTKADGTASFAEAALAAGMPVSQDHYPREEGEILILGPEVFVDADREVISWKGENFYQQMGPIKPKITDKDRELIAKKAKETIQKRDEDRLKQVRRSEAMGWAVELQKARLMGGHLPNQSTPEIAEDLMAWLTKQS